MAATDHAATSKKQTEIAGQEWLDNNSHSFDVATLRPGTAYGPLAFPSKTLDEMDTAAQREFNPLQGEILMTGLWAYIKNPGTTLQHSPYPCWTSVLDIAELAVKALLYPAAGGQRYQIVGCDIYHNVF